MNACANDFESLPGTTKTFYLLQLVYDYYLLGASPVAVVKPLARACSNLQARDARDQASLACVEDDDVVMYDLDNGETWKESSSGHNIIQYLLNASQEVVAGSSKDQTYTNRTRDRQNHT
jgi:hypothetical protein